MKKITLSSLIAMTIALTACDKQATEVKKEQASTPVPASTVVASAPTPASDTVAQQDPISVLKSDKIKIEQFMIAENQKHQNIIANMGVASQKKDIETLKKLLPEYKQMMSEMETGLNALSLGSPEHQKIRKAVIDMNHTLDHLLDETVSGKPNENTIKSLQQQLTQSQTEIVETQQAIDQKILMSQATNGSTASVPVSSDTPAKK